MNLQQNFWRNFVFFDFALPRKGRHGGNARPAAAPDEHQHAPSGAGAAGNAICAPLTAERRSAHWADRVQRRETTVAAKRAHGEVTGNEGPMIEELKDKPSADRNMVSTIKTGGAAGTRGREVRVPNGAGDWPDPAGLCRTSSMIYF